MKPIRLFRPSFLAVAALWVAAVLAACELNPAVEQLWHSQAATALATAGVTLPATFTPLPAGTLTAVAAAWETELAAVNTRVAEKNATRTALAQPSPTPTPTPFQPQEVSFHGKAVYQGQGVYNPGLYYPPAQDDALIAAFLHSARNDMSEWKGAAATLHELGYGAVLASYSGCEPAPKGCPMKPPKTWFPPTMPETWLFDSLVLPSQISELTGVPPSRTVFIGSSIGADGAVIACAQAGCAGALALSPGNFLALAGAPSTTFLGALKKLLKANPQATVWCVANEKEIGVCKKAEAAGGANYRAIEVPGGGHGSELVDSQMGIIVDFLREVEGK